MTELSAIQSHCHVEDDNKKPQTNSYFSYLRFFGAVSAVPRLRSATTSEAKEVFEFGWYSPKWETKLIESLIEEFHIICNRVIAVVAHAFIVHAKGKTF